MQIEPMCFEDLEFALKLIDIEKWGQGREEVEDLFELSPDTIFIAKVEGTPVGMAFGVKYDKYAFLADVIVCEEERGKGYGKKLVQHTLATLNQQGIENIYLDGVPKITPLYAAEGFKPMCKSFRLYGQIPFQSSDRIRQMEESDLDEICAMDFKYFQSDRSLLLITLFQKHPDLCKVYIEENQIQGYIMAAPRENCIKVGPWVVNNPKKSVKCMLTSFGSPSETPQLFIGILESQQQALQIATDLGFESHYFSIRMHRGPNPISTPHIFAIMGPDRG
ncbi:hypothetical protein NEF87_002561 [Candidatus Lokiarchaeum ossiferum]|uniref:N-acetyltransferase domain-containing protein n=1 Tax=Candidatus Lokiarchaeum ossiferum TaxID=2951803 RepID=A0ABY6HUM4_9ARCH|nr:hypothetical protein NEF87_002561 [Candidatus Lokiarchaeum sp. B-35]